VLPTPQFLTTTENLLTDYRVIERFGVVRGITVRSRSIFGFIGAKFQQLLGGDITLLTDLCEQTRAAAFDLAVQHAKALGANALLALRYDATEIMPGVSEVLCYGTAARTAARVVRLKERNEERLPLGGEAER
jgi:uncharacterized protein YbjQ (UPF0145 family)